MPEKLAEFLPYILPLLIAVTLHEAAHGFMAFRLGDMTAKLQGRVTLNPLRHIDRQGTILMPGMLWLAGSPMLFGYAKPVPVNFSILRGGKRGEIAVAFAGPAMNLLLAYISALLLHIEHFVTPEQAPFLFQMLYISVALNVVLALFNLLPLLPLDGGRILNALLPPKISAIHAKSERAGLLVVLALFMIPALLSHYKIIDIPISYYLIGVPADFVRDLVLRGAGIGLS